MSNSCPSNVSGFETASAVADQEHQTWSKPLANAEQVLQEFRATNGDKSACNAYREKLKRAKDALSANGLETPTKANILTDCTEQEYDNLLGRIRDKRSTMSLVLTVNKLTKVLINLRELRVQYQVEADQLTRFSSELQDRLKDCERLQ